VIAPDATTMLIDAGDVHRPAPLEQYYVSPRPDGSRRPGEWIARYLSRGLRRAGRDAIDTFFLTHFHGDHMGSVSACYPKSRFGGYQLTGISDVAEVIRIHRIVDRGWPSYTYPAPLVEPDQVNYLRFVRSIAARGTAVEAFLPGSRNQFAPRRPDLAPSFQIRNLAANGVVWTGAGDSVRAHFPDPHSLSPGDLPDENMCSAAVRLDYGEFSYFTAGDMTSRNRHSEPPWRDIETPVARAAGRVTVAVANHHGYIDACGPEWVRALQPRCFVIQAWTSAHPTMPAIRNMLSTELYDRPRSIFATAVRPESRIAVRELDEMASANGHVIVRVPAPGSHFEIFILSDRIDQDQVTAHFGPWPAR
jgi:hypothetical protein